jgi:hypothetical protein
MTVARIWRQVIVGALLLCGVVVAVNAADEAASSRVPKPVLTDKQGDKCVADTAFMVRNHMDMLKHHRDQTVHEGIRTKQYSLQNCINCHASKKNGAVIGTNENFCQTCHSYAAVKLDCFECHSTKPKGNAAFHPMIPAASAESHVLAADMRKEMGGKIAQSEAGATK